MYELILGTAQSDERVRAVYMNGSRRNPNIPKDMFQDDDMVYAEPVDECGVRGDKLCRVLLDKDGIWEAVFLMCDLFDEIAPEVGKHLGCTYNQTEAGNGRLWLERVRSMPGGAAALS